MDKIQITTKKYDATMQRFELFEGYDRITHSRALLIVRQLNYKPVSNYTMRPVRKKPYQEQTLTLHIPLKLDDDGLDRNKMKRLS
jgi:hypothetical protein